MEMEFNATGTGFTAIKAAIDAATDAASRNTTETLTAAALAAVQAASQESKNNSGSNTCDVRGFYQKWWFWFMLMFPLMFTFIIIIEFVQKGRKELLEKALSEELDPTIRAFLLRKVEEENFFIDPPRSLPAPHISINRDGETVEQNDEEVDKMERGEMGVETRHSESETLLQKTQV